MSPATFDVLVEAITPDSVLSNESNNAQMPVEQ
jgi:hypothetical protein